MEGLRLPFRLLNSSSPSPILLSYQAPNRFLPFPPLFGRVDPPMSENFVLGWFLFLRVFGAFSFAVRAHAGKGGRHSFDRISFLFFSCLCLEPRRCRNWSFQAFPWIAFSLNSHEVLFPPVIVETGRRRQSLVGQRLRQRFSSYKRLVE